MTLLTPGLALPTVLAVSVSSGRLTTCSLPLEELSWAREFPLIATDRSSQHSDATRTAHSNMARIRSHHGAKAGPGRQMGLGIGAVHLGGLKIREGVQVLGKFVSIHWANFGWEWCSAHPCHSTLVCGWMCCRQAKGGCPGRRQDARASASPPGHSFWPTAPQQGAGKHVLFWH